MITGLHAESLYKPTAYWFSLLNFLDASLTPGESQYTVKISQHRTVY